MALTDDFGLHVVGNQFGAIGTAEAFEQSFFDLGFVLQRNVKLVDRVLLKLTHFNVGKGGLDRKSTFVLVECLLGDLSDAVWFHRLVQREDDRSATIEVDIEEFTASEERRKKADTDQNRRDNVSDITVLEEIHITGTKQRPLGRVHPVGHTQLSESPTFSDFEQVVCEKHGGKHADRQTDDQSDRKAFDRLGTNVVQDQGTDEGCQVRVEDRRPCTVKAVSDCHPGCRILLTFFPDPFEDQYVCIDTHTNREDKACKTCKGQRLAEKHHAREDHRQVEHQ